MLRIIFLCGSMEPGMDGVGDYTRRLSAELIRIGHRVDILALNDRFISEESEVVQLADGTELRVLRLPGNWSNIRRFNRAKKWIMGKNPEVISLQFVPYSFHRKGVPVGIDQFLLWLDRNYRWHIMFHELWLDNPNRFVQKAVAQIQQFVISRCVNRLKPVKVNVSVPYNKRRLQSLGIASDVLEIFGNIPDSRMRRHLVLDSLKKINAQKLLFFGLAPRGPYLTLVLNGLAGLLKKTGKHFCMVIVGADSPNKSAFIQALQESLSQERVSIIDCGYLNSDTLSSVIRECHVGVARSDPQFLGKSGSAIAMLEHGLPIWMPKLTDLQLVEYSFRRHLIFTDLNEALRFSDRSEYHSLLPGVARQFISQLTD
ncbi:hypothetical protein [Larkinella soli]|uniref:hypothetical protein n=1 Tax=Larkinella soli TaxID=1770527 RepID=UPI000FFBAED4|nr:hypothetical protein [Larkinella soli]